MTSKDSDGNNKTLLYVGGALVLLAGAGFFYYKLNKKEEGKKAIKNTPTKDPKIKYKRSLHDRFESVNVCPGKNGKDCYFTSDPMNAKAKITTGSLLIRINDERCFGWTFKKILERVQTCELPITAEFIKTPQLEKDWEKAEELKQEANKIYKQSEEPDKFKKAVEKYSEAIALHETRKEYYSNRVLCYFNEKQDNLALEDVDKFSTFDPLEVWQKGFHLKGLTYLNLGRKEEALEAFKKGISIDDSSKWGIKMQKRVEALSQ